jgi:hypothetical protein
VSDGPIFVVGCPRSGTGLVRDLLRSHPRLSLPPESHFIPAYRRAYGDPASDREARALGRRILELRRLRAWGVDLEPAAFDGCRSFADVVARVYDAFARREGKPRWGDKTPHYVAEIPLLLELFPSARVVHVIRDGRDVALSWIRAPFGPGTVYAAAGAWTRYVSAGRRHHGDARYGEVRYEDLLRDPRATMAVLCEFVGEEPTEEVLRPDLGARRLWGLSRDPGPWQTLAAHEEIVRDNHGKWRAAMTVADRTVFESVADELTAELGYPVEGLGRPLRPAEHARLRAGGAWRMGLRVIGSPRRVAGTVLDHREATLRTAPRRALRRSAFRSR